MIDFSTLKGLTIPEGVVKQITDSLGRVLWSMSQPVTVTLTGAVSNSYVEYNGTRYMFPSTFEANTGDTINFHCGDVPSSATIYLNNNQVASGQSSVNHSYTVTCDLNVHLQTSGSGSSVQAKMYITENPEGHALVNITGSGNATHSYVEIDGVKYTSFMTLAVPIGTVITCHVSNKYGGNQQSLTVNGVELAEGAERGKFTYEHTVSKNVSIYLTYTASIDEVYGTISITE